jgi:hypothetical protein
MAFLGHALWPVEWWWVHGFHRLVYAVASAMVFPALDGMCLDYLSSTNTTSNGSNNSTSQAYGQERLWGAISWGITNMVLAIGLDRMGFRIMYGMSLAATVLTLAIVHCYVKSQLSSRHAYIKPGSNVVLQDDAEEDDDNDDEAQLNQDVVPSNHEHARPTSSATVAVSSLQILRLIGSTLFGASFMLAQVTQSSGQAVVDQLIFLYFGDELGSSYTVMGATVVLTVIFEIPIFYIAPVLLQKWGPGPLIPLAAVSYVSRVIGYSLLTNPIHVLWLEPLHGVTYACMATAGVEIVVTLQRGSSSPTTTAQGAPSTGQSALQVLTGIGSISGLVVGGWLQETLGPRIMYRVAALVVSIGASVFTMALLRRQEHASLPIPLTEVDHVVSSPHGNKRQNKNSVLSKNETLELVSLMENNNQSP